ncbi:beta-galactosidase 13-like [Euphorbia lathyris]|uniref:beta-galactosidase 13-like n=1 Tax=Euphorbia lathyris TaxID=212925 RepID=UPI00331402EA
MHLLLIIMLSLLLLCCFTNGNNHRGVTYDGRSLIINGKRELLFSGSVHYTRSTPRMWSDILSKARDGGLNVIQTYVFWNIHEPVKGKYNFEGQYDVVKFIKLIDKHGMYATLRVGPFIEAEWNHGGLPFWLREEKNITFRTDNPQFKYYMERYMKMIIKKMKEEKLFAPQGGPIILAQVENEYNNLENVFKEGGSRYIDWAAKLGVSLKTGVPWIMCKQNDAPDPLINTCNGRQCGDTFAGPNSPNKPSLWTENWTAQHRYSFGEPPSHRTPEDLAYSVARWFSKNGTLTNYYMYHGGTNFGRTTASFVTTRYYDDAPLDEFGLKREPKWSHLKHLHSALKLCSKALLFGTPSTFTLGDDLEARVYEKTGKDKVCAAFLTNRQTLVSKSVDFRGHKYILPPESISILHDCKNVIFNTNQIVSQHNQRNLVKPKNAKHSLKWKMYKEKIPTQLNKMTSTTPLELYGLTKDTSDYAWYTTRIKLRRSDLPQRKDISTVLQVASLGHAMVAFVNGEFVGAAHGSNIEKSFVLEKGVKLKPGTNTITLLASLMGLPDSGAYLERRVAGPRGVALLGLNTGRLDLTYNSWSHQVGLDGERHKIYSEKGSTKVHWTNVEQRGPALTWYKTHLDTPEGKDPVAVRMTGMGKGMIWINGKSIGRYWMSFLSPLGQPSQSEYHIPRSFLHKHGKNVMVILEEERARPERIEILTVNRDTICSLIEENNEKSGRRQHRKIMQQKVVDRVKKEKAELKCPSHKRISGVDFASFGNPSGLCGEFVAGNCTSSSSKKVVEKMCLGRSKCKIPIHRKHFQKQERDDCPDIQKVLAVQLKCSKV